MPPDLEFEKFQFSNGAREGFSKTCDVTVRLGKGSILNAGSKYNPVSLVKGSRLECISNKNRAKPAY